MRRCRWGVGVAGDMQKKNQLHVHSFNIEMQQSSAYAAGTSGILLLKHNTIDTIDSD